MMLRRWALVASLLLLLGNQVLAAGGLRRLEPIDPPALSLNDLGGTPHTLAAYRGKVVLVNFWATWCPPCRREMPSMQRLKEKMTGQDFVILGIDSAEPRDDVTAFLETVRVDFPILLDPESAATKRWKVYALPTSFLIDRHGKVRYSLAGPAEWDEGEAIRHIELLLREQ
jgi:thiol-disulfide isomerase/thioredoxin